MFCSSLFWRLGCRLGMSRLWNLLRLGLCCLRYFLLARLLIFEVLSLSSETDFCSTWPEIVFNRIFWQIMLLWATICASFKNHLVVILMLMPLARLWLAQERILLVRLLLIRPRSSDRETIFLVYDETACCAVRYALVGLFLVIVNLSAR